MQKHIFNHIKDKVDKRDLVFKSTLINALPTSIDLSSNLPAVLNQGNFGSCSAHTMTYALLYTLKKENEKKEYVNTIPSRFFIYANGRIQEGSPVEEDTGCSIRGIYSATSKYFACDESIYPYVSKNAFVKPPSKCYTSAKTQHKTFQYLSIPQNLKAIKSCLAQGFVISFGLQIYESFESDACMQTGIVPIPDVNTESLMGGHALTLCGYNDKEQMFLFINSWGKSVGLPTKRGYFKIPYEMIKDPNLASDFWSLRLYY